MRKVPVRGWILREAARLTLGARPGKHGDPVAQHRAAAGLWSAYLGMPVRADQVAVCMMLLKVSRTMVGAVNADNYVDGAAYMGIAYEARVADEA